ncbi:unnamed protein product [Linum trigynum]|uniref:Uncharacterized protein n=1 Tax=Linum trigynum TaxID=586398 RepID=A0AAV2DFQ9_9ROSI
MIQNDFVAAISGNLPNFVEKASRIYHELVAAWRALLIGWMKGQGWVSPLTNPNPRLINRSLGYGTQ